MIKDDNFEEIPKRAQARIVTELQGCGVIRSRRVLGGVGVGFLTTLGVGVRFFCPTWMSDWIIFCIMLLNWEFLF